MTPSDHGSSGAAAFLAAAAVALSAGAARAGEGAPPPPLGAAALSADLHLYFEGEVREASVFAGAGMAAAAVASVLLEHPGVGRGAAYPLIGVGIIQIAAGLVLHLRTDAQVAKLDALLASDPAALRAAELRRMERVVVQFLVLEVVELALAAGGAGMAIAGAALDEELLTGIGVGLGIQALVMFGLDWLAHRRASRYLASLRRFEPTVP